MLFDLKLYKKLCIVWDTYQIVNSRYVWVVSLQVLFISYTFIFSSFAFISLCSYKKKSRQQTSV